MATDLEIQVLALQAAGMNIYGDRWQAQLAEDIGVSKAFISMCLKGQRRLRKEHMIAVAGLCQQWLDGLEAKRKVVQINQAMLLRLAATND